jgi:hypothetical protein
MTHPLVLELSVRRDKHRKRVVDTPLAQVRIYLILKGHVESVEL